MSISIAQVAKSLREDKLSRDQLEDLFNSLSSLYAEMEIRMGELEKEEAIFLNECGEKTRAGAEMKFNATEKGQESITLKHNLRALSKLISSVKHRVIAVY